jgi:SEC-C motif-containing protein
MTYNQWVMGCSVWADLPRDSSRINNLTTGVPLSQSPDNLCPCGSQRCYGDCCGRYHAGASAPDAEALMRSRYCAYVIADRDYLLATWHPSTRPATLELHPPDAVHWLGLSIRRHQVIDATHAEVEFVARSRSGSGSASRLHEISRFVREGERWYYLDGSFPKLAL